MPEKKDACKKPQWVAQFSMGQLDYLRLDEIIKTTNNFAVEIMRHNFEAIYPFSAQLRTFYINLRPLMSDKDKEEFDKIFQKLRKLLNRGFVKGGFEKRSYFDNQLGKDMETIDVPESLYEDLTELYSKLLQKKQEIGLGTEMKRLRTPEENIKKAFE